MNPPGEKLLLKIRRWFNPGEWNARLIGLSKSSGTASSPGLVMIQIDGFSKRQLEKALDAHEMPFLKRLLSREHYRLYSHYPGLPSATPAVQGKLFYGVSECVPGFFFYDASAQKYMQMSSADDVRQIEQALASQGCGLLEGGSSYANIFTGGAGESHFCASSLGWDKVWKDVNPLNFVLLAMTHFMAFMRMTVLCLLETFLACGNFFYGVCRGEKIKIELCFIPIRVAVCILLRELVTVGAKIDVARGLPVIHLNFLGYDELAHRRGPSSLSAHWSLRGIDQCIAQIYKSALHSARRHYDVWIYSDHGQQETVPYFFKHGRTLNEAVQEVYGRFTGQLHLARESKVFYRPSYGMGHRARYLGGVFGRLVTQEEKERNHQGLVVVAKGAVGQVYLDKPLGPQEKSIFALQLVQSAKIPLVMAPEGENKVRVWNAQGEFLLPGDAEDVLGKNHPFLKEAAADLLKLCRHSKAGDFVICGLRPDGTYENFVFEHGDHGGPGTEEMDAFILLPEGIQILSCDRSYLSTLDLRRAALHLLGRPDLQQGPFVGPKSSTFKETIRIMTYNVHSCIGTDGKVSAQRVARVISRHEPDIIALQELDLKRPQSGIEDQPHIIAKHLEMLYHFHPSIQIEEEQYGNAVLSRYPMKIKKAAMLPALLQRSRLEPRGALWAGITVGDWELQFINTHLSILTIEGLKQIRALLGAEWLSHPDCKGPVILCGDFNALPLSPVYSSVKKVLRDAQEGPAGHRPKPTWSSHYPVGRIDHVFTSPDIKIVGVQVPENAFNKMVSDHLPLIVDISLSST